VGNVGRTTVIAGSPQREVDGGCSRPARRCGPGVGRTAPRRQPGAAHGVGYGGAASARGRRDGIRSLRYAAAGGAGVREAPRTVPGGMASGS